jgi:excisionase family DNA binding protein
MDQAVALLKTTRSTFYRWLRTGKIRGMKVGRQWRFTREDLERFLKGQGPRIDLPADIGPLVEALQDQVEKFGAVPPARTGEPVVVAVGLAISAAVAAGASDLHLDVHEDGGRIRARIDGVLHEIARYDARLHPALAERVKTMAAMDVKERARSQDGRIVAHARGPGDQVDIRVNTLPALFGEALTLRILRHSEVNLSLDRLDFLPRDRRLFLKWIEAPWGLVLVTGPTGCGKTTTLYSALVHLNRPEVKVLTIEDPVEVSLPGLIQVPLRSNLGHTFASLLRAEMRADPDVILVGEIRDLDTLRMVFPAALTGHLVFSTLHTEEAAQALTRMVDMGADPFVVADATKLVTAQRLVRLVCRECSEPDAPDRDSLERAARLARTGGASWDDLKADWRKAVGCRACKFTGYRGRTLVAEVLEVSPEIGAALRRRAGTDELRTIAVGQGMKTMAAHGVLRAAAGETTLAEVLRVARAT